MEKEFVSYKTALALKELGFDEKCFYHYEYHSERLCEDKAFLIAGNGNKYYKDTNMEKSVNAPTFHQAFRFFREKYNRLHTVNIDLSNNLKDKVFVYTIEDHLGSIVDRSEEYKTYEEAESACLNKLIEMIKS